MSIEFTNTRLWEYSPMLAFIDPRLVILNKKSKQELIDTGMGRYTHEIKDHYFWLIVDYEDESTFITALNNWMKDYPDRNVLHMDKIATSKIKQNGPYIEYDLLKLLVDYIPSNKKIVFHVKE